MDLDKIIKDSFQHLLAEFELRKSFFLNIIHSNIDILSLHAEEWFGEKVPSEFSAVLNSLLNLTAVYFDLNRDFIRFSEQEYEVFPANDIFAEIKENFKYLLNRDIDLDAGHDVIIRTSRKILIDSIINIFLCISQFSDRNTKFKVAIKNVNSSIKFEFRFTNLSKELPELAKLMKVFYSYYTGSMYNFRIGLEIPISNIKKVGGIVHASMRSGNSELNLSISFPSYEFLKTVDDIRKKSVESHADQYSGEIILSLRDNILEMIIRENLAEFGYTIKVLPPEKLKFLNAPAKAVIFDNASYNEVFHVNEQNEYQFESVIVIGDEQKSDIVLDPAVHIVSMPFDINSVVDLIEKRS